jgi:hypothetical protein
MYPGNCERKRKSCDFKKSSTVTESAIRSQYNSIHCNNAATRDDIKTEEHQNSVLLELTRIEAHIKTVFSEETEDRYCVWLQEIVTRRSDRLRRLFEAELLSAVSYEGLLKAIKSLLLICGGAQTRKLCGAFRDILRYIDGLSFDVQRTLANIVEAFIAPLNTQVMKLQANVDIPRVCLP